MTSKEQIIVKLILMHEKNVIYLLLAQVDQRTRFAKKKLYKYITHTHTHTIQNNRKKKISINTSVPSWMWIVLYLLCSISVK